MKSAVHLQKVLVILTVIAAVVLIIFYQETFKNSTFLSYRPSRKNKLTNKFRGNVKDARSQLEIKVLGCFVFDISVLGKEKTWKQKICFLTMSIDDFLGKRISLWQALQKM